jgi:RNA polymerase sigma-70 factor (ECF subfamily)
MRTDVESRVPEQAWQREFLNLLDAHGGTLMAMLQRLCGNRHDAEDVFQDTAVRVCRACSSRPKLQNPRAWILTVGYRAFLDARQKTMKHEDLHDPTDDRSNSPRELVEHSEDRSRVQAAIAGLPEAVREVVVLHYVGGLSLSQTAATMEISEGTVKSRLNAALKKLRGVLE